MRLGYLLFFSLLSVALPVWSEPTISVLGLFTERAILRIDGQQRFLSIGQTSPEGVKLVGADASSATVEVAGKRQVLSLSIHIGSHFVPAAADKQVTLVRSSGGVYIAPGLINGRTFDMIVDTGATYVSMNSHHAKKIGLAYRTKGSVVRLSTANGFTDAYKLKLRSVRVGGIEAKNVDVVIQDGTFPEQVLLGMSFLGKLDMEHRPEGVLVLKQKR